MLDASKLQGVITALVADLVATERARTKQDSHLANQSDRIYLLEQGHQEVLARFIPELHRQLGSATAQIKAFDEERHKVSEQEVRLARQISRLEALETEVEARFITMESKITRIDVSTKDIFSEVKADLLNLQSSQEERVAEGFQAADARRLDAEKERQAEEAAAKSAVAERQRIRQEREEHHQKEERALREKQEKHEKELVARRHQDEAEAAEADRSARAAAASASASAAAAEAAAAALVADAATAAAARSQAVSGEPVSVTTASAAASSGSRLKKLDSAQQKQYKLCKKKLKEIDSLEVSLNAKTIRYRELSDEQKEKLRRRQELEDTVAELDHLAGAADAEESHEPDHQSVPEAAEAEPEQPAEEEKEEVDDAEEEEVPDEEDEASQEVEEDPEVVAARLEAEREAAAAAAEAAAAEAAAAAEQERQATDKKLKQCMKKLKEIDALEAKMEAKGQTFDDLLPEVQEKVSKRAELEAAVAELSQSHAEGDHIEAVQVDAEAEAAQEALRIMFRPEVAASPSRDARTEVVAKEAAVAISPARTTQTAQRKAEAVADDDDDEEEDSMPHSRSPNRPKSKSFAKAKAKKVKKGDKKKGDNDDFLELVSPQPVAKKSGVFGFLGL